MKNEYKAADGEENEQLNDLVEEFYNRLKWENNNDNRVSVIHDYLNYVWQKEADRILESDDCIDEYDDLLKTKKKKQLIIRVGYGLCKRNEIGCLEYLRTLMEILDSSYKFGLYVDDDIDALAGYLHVQTEGKPKKKKIRLIIEALEDREDLDDKADGYLESLTGSILDGMLKYQIGDFFDDRARNAANRKGIDPVALYIKYCQHKGILVESDPIKPRIEQAMKWCATFGPDTDPNLLIPVVLDRTFTCGIFVAGSNFFQELYVGHGGIYTKAEDTAKIYAGINVIRMTDIDFSEDEGIMATLEPLYTTSGFSENVKAENVIEDYNEYQESSRYDILSEYGMHGLKYENGRLVFGKGDGSGQKDIYEEQAERELSASESAV